MSIYKLSFDKDVLKLISEVKKRELLWNTKNVNYCNRFHRSKAWRQISVALGVNERSLRSKWKNLRDTFNKEFKLFKGPEHKVKWKYFAKLMFLQRDDTALSELTEEDISVMYFDESDNFESLETENSVSTENNYVDCNNIIKNETIELSDYDRLEDKADRWNSSATDEDYDKMFLNSLIPYFRRIDPVRRLTVRNKIQELLLNEISGKSGTGDSKKQ